MVAKKKATPRRAVAKIKNTAVMSLQEEMQKELATIDETVGSVTGSTIKIDQTRGEFFEMPGIGQAEAPMDVVIVDYISQNMFWDAAYDEDNPAPPVCFAIGKNPSELVPSPHCSDKQADSCSVCPNNEFESAPVGRGKACKNTRVLAVLPPESAPDAIVATLRVSPTGLKGVDTYITSVAKKFNLLPVGVVTELGTQKQGKGFTVTCSNPRPNANMESDWARRTDAKVLLEAEPDMSASEETPRKRAPVRKKAATRRPRQARR